ncbi:polyubiquitin isoform X5, partial [Tanacetum coccineum]
IFIWNINAKKSIPLVVSSSDTIADVKAKIFDREGYPPLKQKLYFAGKELNDNRRTLFEYHNYGHSTLDHVCESDSSTLADYSAQDKTTLHCMNDIKGWAWMVRVYVKNVKTRKTVRLAVESSITINNVKAKIQDEVDIPADLQVLFLSQKKPRGRLTLAN